MTFFIIMCPIKTLLHSVDLASFTHLFLINYFYNVKIRSSIIFIIISLTDAETKKIMAANIKTTPFNIYYYLYKAVYTSIEIIKYYIYIYVLQEKLA